MTAPRKPDPSLPPSSESGPILTTSKFATQILVPSLVAAFFLNAKGLDVSHMTASQITTGLVAAIVSTLFVLFVEHKGEGFLRRSIALGKSELSFLAARAAVNSVITALVLWLFF